MTRQEVVESEDLGHTFKGADSPILDNLEAGGRFVSARLSRGDVISAKHSRHMRNSLTASHKSVAAKRVTDYASHSSNTRDGSHVSSWSQSAQTSGRIEETSRKRYSDAIKDDSDDEESAVETPTASSQGELEPLFCFTSFHPRETQSKISVWESSVNGLKSKTFGTLIVRSSEDQVQTSTFKCSINLIVEVDMCSQDLELRALERGTRRAKQDDKDGSEGSDDDKTSTRKRRRLSATLLPRRNTRRQNSASTGGEGREPPKSSALPPAEEGTPASAQSRERDRRGRKSLQGGSARDSFTDDELERLRHVQWPVEKRNKDGLPAVWCPRCYLEREEFLHLQVSTRVTTKGEPRIDLRHAKCSKGFAADIFPKSIIESYLRHALDRHV